MKRCPSCDIEVGAPFEYCPLCQNQLEDSAEDTNEISYFPEVTALKKRIGFYKIQLFIVLCIAIICLSIEFVFGAGKGSCWSVVVIAWLVAFEVLVGPLLKNKPVAGNFITNIALLITADMAVTCYFFGNMNVCTHYQIPIIILVTLVANFILSLVDKNGNALVYALCNVLVGIVPDVVMQIRNGHAPVLWNVCLLVCAITLVALLIFKGTKVTSEISKRLNM